MALFTATWLRVSSTAQATAVAGAVLLGFVLGLLAADMGGNVGSANLSVRQQRCSTNLSVRQQRYEAGAADDDFPIPIAHTWPLDCHMDHNKNCLLSVNDIDCIKPRTKHYLKTIPGSDLKFFSQNGEDGVLLTILRYIGTTNRYYVEFGVENGMECNTRVLRDLFGWKGLLMDGSNENPDINLHKEFIGPENINELFAKYNVPDEFDVLSIDLDFNDYFVWKAIDRKYRPRVVVVEYNGAIPMNESRVIDPTDTATRNSSIVSYSGCSQRALYDLAPKLGYHMVGAHRHGVNTFFIRADILECQGVKPPPFEQVWQPRRKKWPRLEYNTSRKWIFLDKDGKEAFREYREF